MKNSAALTAYADILALHEQHSLGQPVEFYKDQVALEQDAPADKILLITSGQFSVSYLNEHNKKQFTAGVGKKGDILGATPMISRSPFYDFSAIAKKRSDGIFIDYKTLSDILESRNDLKEKMTTVELQKMQQSLRQSAVNATMTSKDRIVKLLVNEYKKALILHPTQNTVKLKMSRLIISDKIGISREVTGKMMKELKQEGFIDFDGYATLIHPNILNYQVDYHKYKPSHQMLKEIEEAVVNWLYETQKAGDTSGIKTTQREIAAQTNYPLHQVRDVVGGMIRNGQLYHYRGVYHVTDKLLEHPAIAR